MNAIALKISDISIRQDNQGRYCLNDLHKSAGNESKHRPSLWLKNQQAVELIAEISRAGIPALEKNQPVNVINGGNQQGTFVAKELVYAYAMWISPKFSLQVIRAYDALATQPDPDDELTSYYLHPDGQYRLECPALAQSTAITTPLTLAQFNERQKALDAAQAALSRTQIIVTAADLLPKPTKGRKTKAIAPRKWTPEEKAVAEQMRSEGHTMSRIAQQLHRTTASVIAYFRYAVKQAKQGGVK